MPFLKKNVITLLIISLVYCWFFLIKPVTHPAFVNVSGANSNISVFIQPESGKKPILDAINNAQKEILVEVYLLSDKQIISSLEEAKSRGIDVRVILEQHPFGGGGLNPKTKQELESNGVLVKWSNPKFSLTHEKAIIIDGKKAFILNQNLTASSFSKNREYDIIDNNLEDVLLIRKMFIADWERGNFSLSNSHLLESPDTSRGAISALISQAKQAINIEMEVIEDNEMENFLCEKQKHITVHVLLPTLSQINSNKKALARFKNCQIAVKILSSPYIHAKLILIDNLKAYVGSVNLSTQSMDQNRELGIMLSSPSEINLLSETFNSDWQKASDYSPN
jgi:cardiolipin synthase A/B